jgi:hypothetical protein
MFEYTPKVKRYSIRILHAKLACYSNITRQNVIENGGKGRKAEGQKGRKAEGRKR